MAIGRFVPTWYAGQCRRHGWYISDLRRNLTGIFIGNRYEIYENAEKEAKRLEQEIPL